MTPTPEGKQLAADLANAERVSRKRDADWTTAHFGGYCDDACAALARLATEHLALKAQLEEALADLREIWLIARRTAGNNDYRLIETIATKWRVETDPLLEAMSVAMCGVAGEDYTESAKALRAELSKRGYEIGRKS